MATVNRIDQYDVVHSIVVHEQWSHVHMQYVEHVFMRCGIRLVTSDTQGVVTCLNCLTGKRDWKYG